MTQTALTSAELSAFAEQFGLGEVHASERIIAGTINSNFRIETSQGLFFLRINEGKSTADVAYEIELVDAIGAAGLSAPKALSTRSGARFADHHGKQVCVFPWVRGTHKSAGQLTARDLEVLGEELAAFHAACVPIRSRFGRTGIYTTAAIEERVITLSQDAEPMKTPELSEAIDIATAELAWLRDHGEKRAEPNTVIHGDLFPDNVLWDGARVSALLDFEQASTGAALYDLAVCINSWCFADGDPVLRPEIATALISSYRRASGMAIDAEVLAIENRAAAIRFAVTRITDVHLAGLTRHGKDYRDFLDRLKCWHEGGPSLVRSLL